MIDKVLFATEGEPLAAYAASDRRTTLFSEAGKPSGVLQEKIEC